MSKAFRDRLPPSRFKRKIEGPCLNSLELIEAANKRRKGGSLYSVWSLDGKIYVKSTPEGSPVRILTEEDLKDI